MKNPFSNTVLQYPAYRTLWFGQLIAQLGDSLYRLVFLWMALALTNDAGAVGTVGAFEVLPYVLLAPLAGSAADRFDRRKILVLTDILSAVIVSGFIVTLLLHPKPALWAICLFAFMLGSAGVFSRPARGALTPSLVPPDRLVEANAMNSTMENLMPLIGTVVSAVFLQAVFAVNPTLAYFYAFSFYAAAMLASAAFMFRLPFLKPETTKEFHSVLKDTKEGLSFVVKHPVLGPAMLANLCLNFFIAPFMPAYIVLVQIKLHGTPGLLAVLDIFFFVGMMFGSAFCFRLKERRVGVLYSVSMGVCALTVIPLGFSTSWVMIAILNFFTGLSIPTATIPLNTLIQSETPDELRGRVNASMGLISSLVMPVGVAMSGFLLKWIGVKGTFLFCGIGFGLCPLFALLNQAYRTARLPDSASFRPGESIEAKTVL